MSAATHNRPELNWSDEDKSSLLPFRITASRAQMRCSVRRDNWGGFGIERRGEEGAKGSRKQRVETLETPTRAAVLSCKRRMAVLTVRATPTLIARLKEARSLRATSRRAGKCLAIKSQNCKTRLGSTLVRPKGKGQKELSAVMPYLWYLAR